VVGSDASALRALVVDDNPGDLALVRHHLNAIDAPAVAIDSATSLREARTKLADHDVVLLDLTLPDARELEAVRELVPATSAPVLVLTGASDVQLGLDAISAGAEDVLVKGEPGFAVLARTVRTMLERRDLQRRLCEAERWGTIGKVAAAVAHELHTPAAYLALNQKALRQRLEACEAANCCDAVPEMLQILSENDAGLQRLRGLLDDLRAFNGRPHLREEVLLHDVVRRAVRFARPAIPEDAEVTLALDDVSPVRGDPRRLGEIVSNLFINACHATRDLERPRIDVHSWDDAGYVHLEVRDDGPGVPEEHRSQVFEPFFTTKERGWGLGLALSAEIAKQHGGTLTCEPGEHGTFRLRLPRAGEEEDE